MDAPSANGALFKIEGSRCEIPSAERDRVLLSTPSWSDTAKALEESQGKWQTDNGHLFRRVTVRDEGEHAKSHRLWEALLRFPNAPLYATHGMPDKPFPFQEPWLNLHTMRVLGSGDRPGQPIKHVYLLHNGLNETTDMMFHYRLAAWILHKRRDAVCILRPLPGHLTRYPFDGPYASTPLDDYLRDPADLFRQFLRYMLETQWLLSALVPRSQYLISAGTLLLGIAPPRGGRNPRRTGRAYDGNLAKDITAAWTAAFDSNERLKTGSTNKRTGNTAKPSGHSQERVTPKMILAAIAELRQLLGWEPELSADPPKAQRADGPPGPAEPERPCIHVVGYSMGGFMAQAVFFAWPFAVSSCTNLFAGGALRDLAPTAFAHREEWQAVLHGMRYELDRAFSDGHLSASGGLIAGVEASVFGYLTRIFYEVFLQYYRGGYASRVSEFSRRLLFVVGGDDPIVRTKNVLDAGPPQGMTLLQIADVSHFPGGRGGGSSDGGKVENEQRAYWLPEVGRVIANFSERAEGLLNRTLAESWGVHLGRQAPESDTPAETSSRADQTGEQDLAMLDSSSFATEMRTLVRRIRPRSDESEARGWLLVGRNEVPPAFLEQKAFVAYAQAVHHSEEEITSYIKVLHERSEALTKDWERVSLLIPEKSEQWFRLTTERERFFAKSETASAARIPDGKTTAEMWSHFEREWLHKGAAGRFLPNEYSPEQLGQIGIVEAARLKIAKIPLGGLPDVWISLSDKVCETIRGDRHDSRDSNEPAVVEWAVKLAEEWSQEHTNRQATATISTSAAASHNHENDEQAPLKRLASWLASGEVMAIGVSPAELNSRHRGMLLSKAKDVRKAIIHWALAYEVSELSDCEQPL